uniref:Uncharacterized protein n=1 Tax=Parascaris equorum TaxID=6256 RepID=A0A914S261_PAREQ
MSHPNYGTLLHRDMNDTALQISKIMPHHPYHEEHY